MAKGYNPNYQDMAVKAAVVGYEELTGIKYREGESEGEMEVKKKRTKRTIKRKKSLRKSSRHWKRRIWRPCCFPTQQMERKRMRKMMGLASVSSEALFKLVLTDYSVET